LSGNRNKSRPGWKVDTYTKSCPGWRWGWRFAASVVTPSVVTPSVVTPSVVTPGVVTAIIAAATTAIIATAATGDTDYRNNNGDECGEISMSLHFIVSFVYLNGSSMPDEEE
jgi:hypothetical protein